MEFIYTEDDPSLNGACSFTQLLQSDIYFEEQFTENNLLNYQDGQDATENQFDDTGLYNPVTVPQQTQGDEASIDPASSNPWKVGLLDNLSLDKVS